MHCTHYFCLCPIESLDDKRDSKRLTDKLVGLINLLVECQRCRGASVKIIGKQVKIKAIFGKRAFSGSFFHRRQQAYIGLLHTIRSKSNVQCRLVHQLILRLISVCHENLHDIGTIGQRIAFEIAEV